jgi:hypothetical protein
MEINCPAIVGRVLSWTALASCLLGPVHAQGVVPGTGVQLSQVGDDFEQPGWRYLPQLPKSTQDVDGQQNLPGGEAVNRRWYEGVKRGQPDVVRVIATPAGGIQGSRASLWLQSLSTGIPGRPSYSMRQDDLIADVNYRLGGVLPVARSPSVVVRVYLPPFERWEQRSGAQFGFRMALEAMVPQPASGWSTSGFAYKRETYWPGIFIEFQTRSEGYPRDAAFLRIRSDPNGVDFTSLPLTADAWWTLGFSVTPDGMVHYYASSGVDPLTAADHLSSQFPYGYRAVTMKTFFFNVCSADDGRRWSTAWIIDDPALFVLR